MNGERKLEVKIGLFLVGTLMLGVIGVLLLGQSRHVFEERVTLHATFADVGGLVQGAPVHVSGVNVGTVSQIMFVQGRGAAADPRRPADQALGARPRAQRLDGAHLGAGPARRQAHRDRRRQRRVGADRRAAAISPRRRGPTSTR